MVNCPLSLFSQDTQAAVGAIGSCCFKGGRVWLSPKPCCVSMDAQHSSALELACTCPPHP